MELEDKEAKKVATLISRSCSLKCRKRNGPPRDNEGIQGGMGRPQTLILVETVMRELRNLDCKVELHRDFFVQEPFLEAQGVSTAVLLKYLIRP